MNLPSLAGLAFLIQSVRCRTKSKKKSAPSGTEITLSAILTNKLKPSQLRNSNRSAIFEQKSFALWSTSPPQKLRHYRPGNRLYEKFVWFCAGWLLLRLDEEHIYVGLFAKFFVNVVTNLGKWDASEYVKTM